MCQRQVLGSPPGYPKWIKNGHVAKKEASGSMSGSVFDRFGVPSLFYIVFWTKKQHFFEFFVCFLGQKDPKRKSSTRFSVQATNIKNQCFFLGKSLVFKKLYFFALEVFNEKVSKNSQEFTAELTMLQFLGKSRKMCLWGAVLGPKTVPN